MDSNLKTVSELPDDVALLKVMILDLHVHFQAFIEEREAWFQESLQKYQNHLLEQQNRSDALEQENRILQEQIRLLLAKRYGRSSEKHHPDQLVMALFDESEQKQIPEPEPETTEVPAHTRKKPKRKPLSEKFPRVEVIHDLEPGEKVCGVDGTGLVEIGRETSEQLDIIPAKIRVLKHIRIKYGCPNCKKGVKTAPLAPQPIPKSMASPGLLAHVAVAKYADALPLHRQESQFKRIGVEIPRSTLAHWMIRAGQLVIPLINLLRDRMLDSGYIQMDETPIQVLKEPGKVATSKSYMWVWRTGPPEGPIILFDYDPSRGGQVPERLLTDFMGYLQTDGYPGYNAVLARLEVIGLGCWSHTRRLFDEVIKGAGKKAKPGKAHQAMAMIQKLYAVEKQAREEKLSAQKRHALRQEKAAPVVADIRAWLEKSLPGVPPKSLLGKALRYMRDQWPRLIVYLEDGRLEIDTNLVENAIRPFVVGRKGWLFFSSTRGADASANLYSLIETAKANALEPYAYLRLIFTELPKCQTVADFEALLPMNIDRSRLLIG